MIHSISTRVFAPLENFYLNWVSVACRLRPRRSIRSSAAATIRARYVGHRRVTLARIVLTLGAAFVGLGVVWLVAANLDSLSPLARFGLVVLLWLGLVAAAETVAARVGGRREDEGSPLVGALRLLAVAAFGAVVFLGVMVAFGATDVPHAIAMLPVAVLTGVAFAAPIQAFAAAQTNDAPFAVLFRFVIMPMFIFSGTFFPISQLPDALQVVAVLTPLWHAVALSRGIALDMLDPALALVNVAYLMAFVVVGLLASYRTFSRKLAE